MYRSNYQNLESKQWSMTAVLGVTALLSVSVGATFGFIASQSTTTLYAPSTTTTSVSSVAAVPVAQQAAALPLQAVAAPEEGEFLEQSITAEAPQASFNWAPVAALIALPTAIAAFLLRRSEGQVKLATAGVAASAVLASGAMALPADATEGIFRLTPCAENAKFQKVLTKEVKAIEKREKLYEVGSAQFQALEKTKAKTQARFAKYAESGLLCGKDGFPHLIAEPGLAVRYGHAGETLIPTVGFLYVAGYIGTTGRTYLQEVSSRQKPGQSEIIIDVPLATSIALKSWDWPNKAVQELATGKLLEDDSKVPVSRR